MRILVNALQVTNASGRHVLLGHLKQICAWTVDRHDYFILHHQSNSDICGDLGPNVTWIRCPDYTSHWLKRSLWEFGHLDKVISEHGIDIFLTTTGAVAANLKVPQITYAMNPWCLVPGTHRKPVDRAKAALQRMAYRKAMKKADVILFLSEYMRQAYRKNAGFAERRSEVVYTGIDDETFRAASELNKSVPRRQDQILSVSAMAPHKGMETVVQALALVHRNHGVAARLLIVGGWPDSGYENKIRRLVRQLGIDAMVEFKGHVPREELSRYNAESRVFCLMSWCESFGIPAVESQVFGTPVISSNCCAIPEVCGSGGVYPEPGDVQAVAFHMARLLTDDGEWARLSGEAKANAERFRWGKCSRPFLEVFSDDGTRK